MTVYKLTAKYGGLDLSYAKWLKQLEDENADQALAGRCDAGQRGLERPFGKVLTTPKQRLDAVLLAMSGHPIFQHQACVLIGVNPKTVGREPDNPEISLEINRIAEKKRRFRYQRIGVILEQKLHRIYRKEGLSVRRRRRCKRARGSRTPMPVPFRPNQRWSLDFYAGHIWSLPEIPHPCRKRRLLP